MAAGLTSAGTTHGRVSDRELDAANDRLESRFMRESWKYSSLKRYRTALSAPECDAPAPDAPLTSGTGVTTTDARQLDPAAVRELYGRTLDTDRFPLALEMLSRATAIWRIDVSRDAAATLTLTGSLGNATAVFCRLDERATLEIVDDRQTSHAGAGLVAIDIGAGARCIHHQYTAAPGVHEWRLTSALLGADSHFESNQFANGAALRRIDNHVRCAGTGGSAVLAGACAASDGSHVDLQNVVEHQAPHGNTEQQFNCIASGRGKLTFNGRIHIHPGARQTDASLTNRNLALGSNAEINTKPELEIYTDDVRCAHGATVGKLSEDAVFYLRSRGLDELTANRMLTHAFLYEHAHGPLAARALPDLLEAL